MKFDQISARKRLLERTSKVLADIVTGISAGNEIELSSQLALAHNFQRVDWGKVALHSVAGAGSSPCTLANQVLGSDLTAFCEYPLFARLQSDEERTWGCYRADVPFLSPEMNNLVYIENKIGDDLSADFVFRVLRWLGYQTEFAGPAFFLLTGKEFLDAGWYSNEVKTAWLSWDERREKTGLESKIEAYLMCWEDVVNACADR